MDITIRNFKDSLTLDTVASALSILEQEGIEVSKLTGVRVLGQRNKDGVLVNKVTIRSTPKGNLIVHCENP